jgi:hypothetical protein
MNKKLQELYESKIRVYERIIDEIKSIDISLISEFEKEFKKIEDIDRRIKSDPELSIEQLLKIKL